MAEEKDVHEFQFPLLVLFGDVFYPGYSSNVPVRREISRKAVTESLQNCNNYIFITTQKDGDFQNPKAENLFSVGTLCKINSVSNVAQKNERINVTPINIVDVYDIEFRDGMFFATGKQRDLKLETTANEVALFRKTLEILEKMPEVFTNMPKELVDSFKSGTSPEAFAFGIATYFPFNVNVKQGMLESKSTSKLLKKLFEAVLAEYRISEIDKQLDDDVRQSAEKSQKEYYLRERLKAIKQELGDGDSAFDDDELIQKIESNPYPEHIVKKVKEELKKANMMPPGSQESALIHNYINLLVDLPWYQKTEDNSDLKKVKEVLDSNHYGLEKVKERIIEYLAVKIMTGNLKSPILCLYGPPGVGKTSLAQSIAEALNRKFVKCSLGGISDEAEIRGHRRTYVGSIPGRIISGMKKAEVINPLFLLDEVDKLDSNYKGDPASALLEVLDPQQNYAFNDNYVEEPYDLSNVLFIATANYLENIPEPLRDRMELIEMNSYTVLEKLEIAKQHLIPKIMKRNNLEKDMITFNDETILYIIEKYTREAGARELERKLESIVRKVIVEYLLKNRKSKRVIDKKAARKYLGVEIFESSKKEKKPQIGVVTGLAYTAYGGEILQIEVNSFAGKGGFIITGQLGDVMKESCSIALDFVKSNAKKYGIDPAIFEKVDIHIHVPEGAVPKDGPSAGVAITIAIISCLSNKKVNSDVAMTGEVTLRGYALPIGGLREKSLAALRNKIKTIIVPKDNKKNIEELPDEVKENLNIIYMDNVDDAYKVAIINED